MKLNIRISLILTFGLSLIQIGSGEILTQSFLVSLARLEEVIHDQKQTIEEQKEANKNLTDLVEEQKHIIEGLNTDIGFTVSLTSSTEVGHRQVIKFDKVISNIGGGYVSNSSDPKYGKFIAPVNGTYFIGAAITTDNANAYMGADIQVNGEFKVNAVASGNDKDSGSCSLVVKLNEEDEVWMVNAEWNGAADTYHLQGTMFFGHLIHADV